MAELGQGAFPRCATRQTCGAYLSLQQEVIQLLDLKRRVQLKQASIEGSCRRLPPASEVCMRACPCVFGAACVCGVPSA